MVVGSTAGNKPALVTALSEPRATYPRPPNCARDGAADTAMSCVMSSTEPCEILVAGDKTSIIGSDDARSRPCAEPTGSTECTRYGDVMGLTNCADAAWYSPPLASGALGTIGAGPADDETDDAGGGGGGAPKLYGASLWSGGNE